jgi:hypothetical protein
VGQYASLEELDGSGAGSAFVVAFELSRFADKLVLLPTHPNTLSNETSEGLCFAALVVVLLVLVAAALELLSHEGSSAETRCMVFGSQSDPGFELLHALSQMSVVVNPSGAKPYALQLESKKDEIAKRILQMCNCGKQRSRMSRSWPRPWSTSTISPARTRN